MSEVRVNGLNALRLAAYLADKGDSATVDDRLADGVWIVDPARTEAELTQVVSTYSDDYIPAGISSHLQHIRDYLVKDPNAITNAESMHVIKDLIRAVHYLNKRFESEG